MFHDNMDHGKLMVLIQKVEGSHPRKRNRGSKKSRSSGHPIQAMVIIRVEFGIGTSSRRGIRTQIIQLLLITVIPRRAMVEILSLIVICVVNVEIYMEMRS